jgi:phosphoenolpyruvate-protein phosphotransferase (PTS system enzyme I)
LEKKLSPNKAEKVFQGIGVSSGLVFGQVLKLDSHNRVVLKMRVGDAEEEVRRLSRAIEASRAQIEALRTRLEEKIGSEQTFILDVHLLILEDRSLIDEIVSIIRTNQCNAEWAVRSATDRIQLAYESLDDEYFRERKSDVEAVLERLALSLSGGKPVSWESLPGDLIVVAYDFSPAAFALMDIEKVRGLALEAGGRTSHTAIIARSLRIPSVMQMKEFLNHISTGDPVLLDGEEGQVIVHPSPERLTRLHDVLEGFRSASELPSTNGSACCTRDGTKICLQANTELLHESGVAKKCGAEGIGLFRSEFLFFGHPHGAPDLSAQLEIYELLAREMAPFPVAIRTLDIGADKILPGNVPFVEPNPSMGLRGIRLSLAAKQAFATQIEAILRASRSGKIEIVLPMVSTVDEVLEAKELIEGVRAEIVRESSLPLNPVAIGAMIEVPAAVLTLETIAREIDFLCVGTNDLTQYLLAVDRGNPRVAHLFQPMHPSVLNCLQRIAEVSRRLQKPVRICGEMSNNPFYAVLLLGMGYTQFSMYALSIPRIRKILQQVSVPAATAIASRALTLRTAREVSEYLMKSVPPLVSYDLSPFLREISMTDRRL